MRDACLKSNFLLCSYYVNCFLSDHNFISNYQNLVIFFMIEREWNKKNNQKSEEEQGEK